MSRAFVELADTLVDDFDVVDLLSHLGERCVDIVDAASAGVLLVDDSGALRLIAATSEAAEGVELFQIQNDEGPCFDCFHSGEAVEVTDLEAASDRWPLFVPIATGAGFRSANAFPLRLRGRVIGALNLFRVVKGQLGAVDAAAAQALADIATIGILQARAATDARLLAEQLRFALDSRVAIEQAKGVLAERAGISMDESFDRLRGYARRNQLLLSEVARGVVQGTISAEELFLPS